MKDAESMRQVSQDNIPDGKIENEVNRVENIIFAEAQKGERIAKALVPYVMSEQVYSKLEEAGYKIYKKGGTIAKGIQFEITW
jgi:hypothetical protein